MNDDRIVQQVSEGENDGISTMFLSTVVGETRMAEVSVLARESVLVCRSARF